MKKLAILLLFSTAKVLAQDAAGEGDTSGGETGGDASGGATVVQNADGEDREVVEPADEFEGIEEAPQNQNVMPVAPAPIETPAAPALAVNEVQAAAENPYVAPDLNYYRGKTYTIRHGRPIKYLKGKPEDTENFRVDYWCADDENDTNRPENEADYISVYFNGIDGELLRNGNKLCPAAGIDDTSSSVAYNKDCKTAVSSLPKSELKCRNTDHFMIQIKDVDQSPPDYEEGMLNKQDIKCFNDNTLNFYFQYGSYDTFNARDLCYVSQKDTYAEHELNRDPMLTMRVCKQGQCMDPSFEVSFNVKDNEENATLYPDAYPLVVPKVHLEIELFEIEGFDMYANQNVAVNIFLDKYDAEVEAGTKKREISNIRSWFFIIQPENEDKCRARAVPSATRIVCEQLSVVCNDISDRVYVTMMKPGLVLDYSATCGDIAHEDGGFGTMTVANLQEQASAGVFSANYANFIKKGEKNWRTVQLRTNQNANEVSKKFKLRVRAFVKHRTNDKNCYIGEVDPYVMPACVLFYNEELAEGTMTWSKETYELPPKSQVGTILGMLSEQGLMSGENPNKFVDKATQQVQKSIADNAKSEDDTLTDDLDKITMRPSFAKKGLETAGIVYDKLPSDGTLMVTKKKPAVYAGDEACINGIDWTEEVVKGRIYDLKEYSNFFVKPDKAGVEGTQEVFQIWPLVGQGSGTQVPLNFGVEYETIQQMQGSSPFHKLDYTYTYTMSAVKLANYAIGLLSVVAYASLYA